MLSGNKSRRASAERAVLTASSQKERKGSCPCPGGRASNPGLNLFGALCKNPQDLHTEAGSGWVALRIWLSQETKISPDVPCVAPDTGRTSNAKCYQAILFRGGY